MPQKSPHTVHILEGKATLYQRPTTPHWQVRYKADGKWLRATTKQEKLKDAKAIATEIVMRAWFREKEGLPVVNKKFKAVAKLAIKRMEEELANGQGKATYGHYIQVINKYLISYLGKYNIDKIDYHLLSKFAVWRKEQFAREPSQSAINMHNSALNRVFDEALMRNLMTQTQVPHLQNKGVVSERRATFTMHEFLRIHRNLKTYALNAREGNEKLVRNVLRNYVLILANTGIRAGTEAMNLKWKHITIEKLNGVPTLKMNIYGKQMKWREIYIPASNAHYLNRIKEQYDDIKNIDFEELLKKRLDKYVFRINEEDAQTKFGKMFARFLESINLDRDVETDKKRTLYSLRHYYATKMIIKGVVSNEQLAKHMGTSPQMIDRHYEHLKMRDVAHKFVGKWTIESELNRGRVK